MAARRRWRAAARDFFALAGAAQDQDLDPRLLATRDETASATDVEARGFQLYRRRWPSCAQRAQGAGGLRVTFPVALSS